VKQPRSDPGTPSLQQQLDEHLRKSAARRSSEVNDAIAGAKDALAATGIAQRAHAVGDSVPDFALPNAVGKPVALSDLLERGPVVLAFYRGVW